ncbi:hypothetical protein PC9H_011693 [Pleurotus ostreatus]|uniref:Uncharacterized protein n=2 Tax=Pleurotus ostreatus TaxID=5322 RepID=A0A067N9T8_PLEO1|nr:uncharacterized protein PC9H_011693 [Pleurotus ostreatus]KAF7421173.1 hypothetical protein PC9H_011693 [Pleurotus ostreatus]KDQ23725.1 hypothetical protein PLEOSDRAFT_1114103 [Pleurotus ostreatus PC15]
MIIDEKSMSQQPPPYVPGDRPTVRTTIRPAIPPPLPQHRLGLGKPSLDALPSHILLQIVYMSFPQTPGVDQGRLERQRKTLYWLSMCLRLVNRSLYIACMHVLRSTYLPAYETLIKPPYSSDPFPLPSPTSQAPSYSSSFSQPESIHTLQRETAVLDLFIAVKVREDVWMDDSELHLEREESFKDIFDLNQPRSRLEDLVRVYGLREGVISVPSTASASTSPTIATPTRASGFPTSRGSKYASSKQLPKIPFSSLSVSFSPRKVGLVISTASRSRRTIVEVPRSRDEKLEIAAKRLVKELVVWLEAGGR